MKKTDLSGVWKLRCESKKLDLPARVPGDTLSALLEAGECQDPYFGTNENDLRWLGQADWLYSRSFEVDSAMLEEKSVILRCDGVDTLAEIFINGTLAGRTENMFREYQFEVKPMNYTGLS